LKEIPGSVTITATIHVVAGEMGFVMPVVVSRGVVITCASKPHCVSACEELGIKCSSTTNGDTGVETCHHQACYRKMMHYWGLAPRQVPSLGMAGGCGIKTMTQY
jgi:hypothetical protein